MGKLAVAVERAIIISRLSFNVAVAITRCIYLQGRLKRFHQTWTDALLQYQFLSFPVGLGELQHL